MGLIYEPLDIDIYEIRMLTILPDPPKSVVRCTIEKTNLINPKGYAALSYCWGDESIKTIILVNGIETPVTTNLADALQHLRQLGVGRLWADALCINQEDRQEKGLQIRNMKLIYERADVTCSWLGREGVDGAMAAIMFLKSLLASEEKTMALKPTPHTCGSQGPVNCPVQSPSQIGDCLPCTMKTHFHWLGSLLQRPYWKRRWIIQELSSSGCHKIICGDANITFREIVLSLIRCRESGYWDSDRERAFAWLMTAWQFRQSYYMNKKPPLLAALSKGRNFESRDPRDAIFSLLGLSCDGSELVPVPNYLQSVDTIVTDLIKALVRKYERLDFILAKEVNPTGLRTLPSWAPDWLSAEKPSEYYCLKNKSAREWFQLGDWTGPKANLGDCKLLRTRGITIGTITSTTSTMDLAELSPMNPGRSTNSMSLGSPTPSYYTSTVEVLQALFNCFTLTSQNQKSHSKDDFRPYNYTVWHTFCCHRLGPENKRRPINPKYCDPETPERDFSRWLKANAGFPIHGKTLEAWMDEQGLPFTHLMRLLDSDLAISLYPVVILHVAFVPVSLAIPTLFQLTLARFQEIPKATINIPQFIPGLTGLVICFLIAVVSILPGLSVFLILYSFHQLSRKVKRFLDASSSKVEPERTLIVADKGFLGMAKGRANKSGTIFYLVGCREPVILREARENDGESGTKYKLVGKCYVHLTDADRKGYREFGFQPDRSYGDQLQEWTAKGRLQELELV